MGEQEFSHPRALSSSETVWRYRPDGIANEQFDTSSAHWWRELTGQSESERTAGGGLGWLNAVHIDDREIAKDYWLKTLISSEPSSAEFRVSGITYFSVVSLR